MTKFTIITGRSGSGKSSCLHLLEDLDYYCIDNLPIGLLASLPQYLHHKEKVAIGIYIRHLPQNAELLADIVAHLKILDIILEVIYLDTNDKVLLERFSATRRKHPLSDQQTSLTEALQQELLRLEPLEQLARYRIDTSRLSIHQLQQQLKKILDAKENAISILFQSFGYKYGIPTDSDFVFDVRCLPNPYWDAKLREKTGKDPQVIDFFIAREEVKQMLNNIIVFIEQWLPAFREDNRNYMTISLGCTGGRHRSVYIASCLYEHFKQQEHNVPDIQIRHRELKL